MSQTAFLFSGQGSQYTGMGVKLQRYSTGKETFQEANDILGMDIAQLCCSGTDNDLADTEITQPAILTCSIAAFRILRVRGSRVVEHEKSSSDSATATISYSNTLSQSMSDRQQPPKHEESSSDSATVTISYSNTLSKSMSDRQQPPKHEESSSDSATRDPDTRDTVIGDPKATAGLSVGEYSALVASEVLSFSDSLKLVKERGRLMAEAAAANPGAMAAILGSPSVGNCSFSAVVESVCQEASSYGVVQPANYNCPGQVVISGEEKAVQRAVELAQKAGAKRCIVLNVSGAFHSPLMRSAESGLRKALSSVSFSNPKIPFIANVTGDYIEEPEEIKETLALQLSSPIQWEASVRRMIDEGITDFVEVGPGKVLAGLVSRIYREAKISSTDDMLGIS